MRHGECDHDRPEDEHDPDGHGDPGEGAALLGLPRLRVLPHEVEGHAEEGREADVPEKDQPLVVAGEYGLLRSGTDRGAAAGTEGGVGSDERSTSRAARNSG